MSNIIKQNRITPGDTAWHAIAEVPQSNRDIGEIVMQSVSSLGAAGSPFLVAMNVGGLPSSSTPVWTVQSGGTFDMMVNPSDCYIQMGSSTDHLEYFITDAG